MATNLLHAGYRVTVHDLRREVPGQLESLGAVTAESACEVAAQSDLIAIAVVDDAPLEADVPGQDGVLAGAAPGAVLLFNSTVSPGICHALAGQRERSGIRRIGSSPPLNPSWPSSSSCHACAW
jgi:3-hydroxyisobutyrate dehydrogenase